VNCQLPRSQESLGKLGIPASQSFFAWDFEPNLVLADKFCVDGIDGDLLHEITEADLAELDCKLTKQHIGKLLKDLDSVRGSHRAASTSSKEGSQAVAKISALQNMASPVIYAFDESILNTTKVTISPRKLMSSMFMLQGIARVISPVISKHLLMT